MLNIKEHTAKIGYILYLYRTFKQRNKGPYRTKYRIYD